MLFQVLAVPTAGLEIGAKILGLAIAIILHEVAHGYVALYLGDPTAKYAGRLSLNPIKHIDLWGTILIPLFLMVSTGMMFGWAKPVPVNYFNLRGGKYGPLWVALAGPGMNLILLAVFALAARLSPPATALPALFITVAFVNGLLMLFNLIPVPPLDGSKVLYLFLDNRPDIIHFLERYGMIILFAIIILGGGLLSRIVFEPTLSLVSFFSGLSVFEVFGVLR
ncbi:MAG: site-2 protease family protein [Patescibacteria group bacterium]